MIGELTLENGLIETIMKRTLFMSVGIWDEYKEFAACINQASDCEEFWRCNVPENGEPCNGYSFEETCEGDVLVKCSRYFLGSNDLFIRRTDCSQAPGGGICVDDGYEPVCQFNECNPMDSGTRCVDDLVLFCQENMNPDFFWLLDCSLTGMQCIPGGLCGIPGNRACDGSREIFCEGPLIHFCGGQDVPTTFDCREIDKDFVCFKDAGGDEGCGMPEGSWECETHEDEQWCDGSIFNACIYGKIISFDCASFAGSACEEGRCTRQE